MKRDNIMNKIEDNLKEIKRKATLLNEVYESFLNTDIIKLAEQTQSLVKNLNIPVMPRFDSPKNWTEDYKRENGNYTCRCCSCKEYFFGHKRRVLCAECANQLVDDFL